MVLQVPSEASYALCQPPSFGIAPDTDLLLGRILLQTETKPKRPDIKESLNTGQIPMIEDSAIRAPAMTPQVVLDVESLRSTSSSIWAHVDFLPGIGGRVGGERSKEKVLLVYAQGVETKYFNPTRAFFAQALNIDPVKDQLGDFHDPVVYMVTGIKVATKASIIVGTKKASGIDIGPEVDLSQFGVPINVGANIVHKFQNYNIVGTLHDQPFVLAYETRRIKVKAEGYKQKVFTDFAVLDDEISDDASETLLEALDIDLMTLELDLENQY